MHNISQRKIRAEEKRAESERLEALFRGIKRRDVGISAETMCYLHGLGESKRRVAPQAREAFDDVCAWASLTCVKTAKGLEITVPKNNPVVKNVSPMEWVIARNLHAMQQPAQAAK